MAPQSNDPISFYKLIVTDEIIDAMVMSTNNHAEEVLRRPHIRRRSRLLDWVPTTQQEMTRFLGIQLYMGIVNYPRISDYWSKSPLYSTGFVNDIMSRNRFLLLLRMWCFEGNNSRPNDRLSKLRYFLRAMNENFRNLKRMGTECVIDESMVAFRGRLSFRQYIPGKAHKYGVKLFKLTNTNGYTFNIRVYAGKNEDRKGTTDDLVMKMMSPYLHRGRLLVVDNFYTSVSLAKRLLAQRTHLLGTLRSNRIGVPKLKNVKLDKGEMIALTNDDCVTFVIWHDKRYVKMLSTKFRVTIVPVNRPNRNPPVVFKPNIVLEYNKCKQGIDLSDQMSSYQCAVRKSVRWYHKVAQELLFGTAIVNGHILYNEYNLSVPGFRHVSILQFKEKVIYGLLGMQAPRSPVKCPKRQHALVKFEERLSNNRVKRKYCAQCYLKLKCTNSRAVVRKKVKQVSTYCNRCPDAPGLCLPCFEELHK